MSSVTGLNVSEAARTTGDCGLEMHQLARRLFPICRSLTGDGVRSTLKIIQEHIPLKLHEVPTGTKVFDWTVPNEWNIRDAFIQDEDGTKIVDFKNNNLHVVGYSAPVDKWITKDELEKHLYSLEELPDAIPYITSYYQERWGFCISHNERNSKLKGEKYRVYIDSDLGPGALTYGEYILPGRLKEEIFISTYVCHPSMANNELSGPVVATYLAKRLAERDRKYTYRIIFIPETIGSITYLSKNLKVLKDKVVAGFNLSCIGDDRGYSFVSSRYGNTLADKVVLTVLSSKHPDFIQYSFLDRGSDERQYCSPGVDLPLVTLCRSKFGKYPEYHTSLDNLDLVTPSGLMGGLEFVEDCIELVERNETYTIQCMGEPQLGKRGLYPNVSTRASTATVKDMMDFIAYADGTNDLIDINKITGIPVSRLYRIVEKLADAGLIATAK